MTTPAWSTSTSSGWTPTIFQVVNGTRRPVEGGYAIGRRGRVGFSVGAYDRRYPLVID